MSLIGYPAAVSNRLDGCDSVSDLPQGTHWLLVALPREDASLRLIEEAVCARLGRGNGALRNDFE